MVAHGRGPRRSRVREVIRELLQRRWKRDPADCEEACELAMTRVDIVVLCGALEEQLNLEVGDPIDDDRLGPTPTIGQLIDLVLKKL